MRTEAKNNRIIFLYEKTAIFISINCVMLGIGLFFTMRSIILRGLALTNIIGMIGICIFLLNIILYRLLKSLYIPSSPAFLP